MFLFMYSLFHINSLSHVCKILVIVTGKIKINYKKDRFSRFVMRYLMVRKIRIHNEDGMEKSAPHDHWTSLVMPNSDPWDFFRPILPLINNKFLYLHFQSKPSMNL